MLRRSGVGATLGLACLVMSGAVAADEPELLRNGSLDSDANADRVPDRWRFAVQKGQPEALYDARAGADGGGAVAIRSTGPEHVGYWSQVIKLEAWMSHFRLRVAVRTEGQAQGTVSFSAYAATDEKWLAADYRLVVAEDQQEWRTDEAQFEVPPGTGSVRIAGWANMGGGGPGAAWFDDLGLVCLDTPPTRPEGNLLSNGDLEDDADGDGTPDGWSLSVSRGEGSRAAEGEAHSGERCAGLTVEAESQALLTAWLQPPEPWPIYRVSLWMRTEGDAVGSVSLSAYDETRETWLAAGYDLASCQGSPQWVRRVGYYRPPTGAPCLKVALWVNYRGAGAGAVWFDDVEVTAVDEIPATPYVPANPPPTLSDGQRAGFALFRRNYLDLMPPSYVPSDAELSATCEVFACPGEYEPLSIGLYSPAVPVEASLTLSPLRGPAGVLEPSCVEVGVVRYLAKRSHYGMNDRVLVPTYIETGDTVRCEPGQVRQFWLTFHVPEDASSGDYEGTATVRAEGLAEQTVPITLHVYPFRLSEPERLSLGMYDGAQRVHPGDDFVAVKYADMRAHGMNTVGFYSALGSRMALEDGRVTVGWDGTGPLEQAMDAYAQAGFGRPVVWLMGGDVGGFAEKAGAVDSDAYAEAYQAVIRAVVERGRERGWPEIIFQPRDEVFAHEQRFERGFSELKLLNDVGVRTEMDGPNVHLERAEQTYLYTDVLVNAYGPLIYGRRVYEREEWQAILDRAHGDGKEIWYYNFDTTGYHVETMRFAYGLYLLSTGADGILSWAYSSSDEDPYDDYSGPRGDTVFVYPANEDHPGGPGLGWEGVREGVDDCRYALTLQRRIEAARASDDPARRDRAAAAEQVLRRWQDRVDISRLRTNRSMQGNWSEHSVAEDGLQAVSGSFGLDVGISFEDYDRFRREVAAEIVALGE